MRHDIEQPESDADQFAAHVSWTGEHPLLPGRPYLMRIGGEQLPASITSLKYRAGPADAHFAAKTLARGEAGVVNVSAGRRIAFPGGSATPIAFELLDPLTREIVGIGTVDFALRRASNIAWQPLDLSKRERAARLGQRPRCVWFTGLPGSGKSTIANRLEKRLHADGRHTYLLDGDNVRHGLSRDLGFSEADRVENIRRVAEVARLMVDAGLVVLVSFISPFRAERALARSLFETGEFVEVFVDTPLEECERRDPKGHYAKARRGELANFTGVDSPYEPPESVEVHLRTTELAPEQAVRILVEHLGQA